MTRQHHRSVLLRAIVVGGLLAGAAAIGQYALDHSLDANPMVGGTGYNPNGRGNAGSLRASSYRLDRRSGTVQDMYGGNSAFARPEYRVGADGGPSRAAYARAGLTRDQVYPSYATTNLRQDDVERRMSGKAYSPNDTRSMGYAGLQSPSYQPYASTSYANPGAVGAVGGGGGGGRGRGGSPSGLVSAAERVPSQYGMTGLSAPSYKPGKRR